MPEVDLAALFEGVPRNIPHNAEDFAYIVAMDDGWHDYMTGRPFTVPRGASGAVREGYAEGYAKAQEAGRA